MKTHYSWILINPPVIFMWVRCLSPALVFGSTDWMSSRNKPFCHRTGLGNIPRSQQQFLLEFEAPFSELLCGHWIWRGPRARSDNTEIERHKRPHADTPGNTIDRQTDRQAGRQTDRHTYIHVPTYLPTYIHTYIHSLTNVMFFLAVMFSCLFFGRLPVLWIHAWLNMRTCWPLGRAV